MLAINYFDKVSEKMLWSKSILQAPEHNSPPAVYHEEKPRQFEQPYFFLPPRLFLNIWLVAKAMNNTELEEISPTNLYSLSEKTSNYTSKIEILVHCMSCNAVFFFLKSQLVPTSGAYQQICFRNIKNVL